MESRVCRRCHIAKPLAEFHRRDKHGQYQTRCKVCRCEQSRDYYHNRRDKVRDRENRRRSDQARRQAKPEQAREKDRHDAMKYRRDHPDTFHAYVKKWRKNNPEKRRQYERINYQNHPEKMQARKRRRRARHAAAPRNDFTAAQWATMCDVLNHRCVYCGRKMKRLTVDHLTPFEQQGSHTLWNILPACQSCNSRKQAGPVIRPVQPFLLLPVPPKKRRT